MQMLFCALCYLCLSEGLSALLNDYKHGSKERKRLLVSRYGNMLVTLESNLNDTWLANNSRCCPHCFSRIEVFSHVRTERVSGCFEVMWLCLLTCCVSCCRRMEDVTTCYALSVDRSSVGAVLSDWQQKMEKRTYKNMSVRTTENSLPVLPLLSPAAHQQAVCVFCHIKINFI